jgi:fibronectin-binding autotransporter adhesin
MRYIVIILLAVSNLAISATKTFNGGATTWDASGSWSPSGMPGPSDDVIINSGTCTILATTSSPDPQCASLTINGGALTVLSTTAIAISGNLSMTGGTMTLGSSSTNIIPFPSVSGSISLTGGTVSYAANTASQVINTTPSYFNLNINRSSKSISSTLNVLNNLTFTNPSILITSSSINVTGSITGTGTLSLTGSAILDFKGSTISSTLTCSSSSTVNYSGSISQTGKVTAYGILKKNGTSNTVTFANGVTAANIQVNTGTLSIGSCSITGSGGNIQVDNGAKLSTSSNFPTGTGVTYTLGSTSTVDYNGGGSSLAALTYGNLSLTSTTRTATANTTVLGNLILSTGTLALAASPVTFTVDGNITGTGNINSNDGYLVIGGSFAVAIVFNNSTSSTVEYAGNSASQTIVPEQYNNLVLSGSSDKILSGTIQIDGNFSSTTSGNITTVGSTVEFNSSNPDQTIPAFTFNKLKVSNANKVLTGDVIVADTNSLNTLILNGTTINTDVFNLRVLYTKNTAILITDPTTDYIIGNLSRNFINGTNTLPFPLGDATLGSLPMDVRLTANTGGGKLLSDGFLTISSTLTTEPTTYPNFAGANFISTSNACNRYWTIANSGFSFTTLRAGLKFFNPDDIGSAVSDPLNFLCRVQKSGVWTDGTLPSIATDTATVSGLTLTSGNTMDIWLGEKQNSFCSSIVTPANWNSAATWSCGKIPTTSDSVVISSGHIITLDNAANVALFLQIDGTAELSSNAIIGNIGNGGILITSTGALTRTSGSPILSMTGNLEINNTSAISTSTTLTMAGTGDSIKTNQTSLSIPRLAINSSLIYNTVPNLTIGTNLTSTSSSNVITQASNSTLTLSDVSTNIIIDASATNAEVIYDNATAQTINNGTYYKLTLTSTSAAAKTTSLATGNTYVTNELKLQTGSAISHGLSITSTSTTLTGTGALFTMGANTALNLGDITLSTAVSFPSTFSTYAFNTASTVNYLTNGVQTVSGTPIYQNLNITTGTTTATKTLGANTTVANALTIVNGTGTATLSLGTNTLNIAGTISGTGTLLCPTNSTVNYNSSSAQSIYLSPSYYNFTTSGAGTKTIPSGTLLIAGNLTTNGTLNSTTNSSTVSLNGTSGSQNISGTNTFYNLSKTGASTIGSVTNMQTVNNLFTISSGSGSINSNGNITIIDGASIIDNNAVSSFTSGSAGYVIIQKSAASANKSYLLTGPISSYSSTTLDAGQGKPVLRYDSDGTPTNITTLYTNSCSPASKQYGSYTGLYKATTGTLEVGKGYSVLQATAKNLSFLGNVNNGTITFSPLSTIDRTIPDGSGYNWCPGTNGLVILGNPYPSAIDWALVYASATGINTSVKIWNGANYTDVSQSDATLANRAIKTGQGFILQVSNFASNSLSFQNAHRISDNNGSLLRTESANNIKIELTDTQNEEFKDILSINFNEKATDGFDPQFDSYDLPGITDVPSLVAIVNGNELSTTEFPTPTENKKLPVIMTFNNESDYEVKIANTASIPNNLKVYLVDQTKKLEYDLSESKVLPFKKGSFGNYEVQLRTTDNNQTQYTSIGSNSNRVYNLNDKIVIENNNDNLSDIAIYDITGKLLLTKNSVPKGKFDIELNNKAQMYVVKLSNNTTTNTYKVILY